MQNRLRPRTPMSLGGLSPQQLAVGMWSRMAENDAMTRAAAVGFYAMLSWFWVVALVLLAAAEMDRAIEAGSPIAAFTAR